ncbi:phenylacetate-CoA oxygenase subunit PaaI [Streptomyces canus]
MTAVRLGDGTDESAARMRAALDEVAPWLDELLTDGSAARLGAEPAVVAARSRLELFHVLADAELHSSADVSPLDTAVSPVPGSGRNGQHTPHLGPLLAELQSVARAHPDASW